MSTKTGTANAMSHGSPGHTLTAGTLPRKHDKKTAAYSAPCLLDPPLLRSPASPVPRFPGPPLPRSPASPVRRFPGPPLPRSPASPVPRLPGPPLTRPPTTYSLGRLPLTTYSLGRTPLARPPACPAAHHRRAAAHVGRRITIHARCGGGKTKKPCLTKKNSTVLALWRRPA